MTGADRADQWGFPNPATPPGSSTYYSLRFAPSGQRDGLAALVGWRHQVRAILDQVADPAVAAAKLHWWRDELQRTRDGAGSHPLSRRLGPLIAHHRLPVEPFLNLTVGTESALSRCWPRDLTGLIAAADRDWGSLLELQVRAAGDQDPVRIARARQLGVYASLVGQIRDCGGLWRRGHYGFIPTDWLAALELTPEDLGRPAGRGRLPALLAELAGKARGLRGAPEDPDGLPASVRIRVRLTDLLLDELAAVGFDLVDQRVALTPIRKLWHAWREGTIGRLRPRTKR